LSRKLVFLSILTLRSLEKLRGTYVDALPDLINPNTGMIHTSFNQAVAATGRLSSNRPNLQNIPIRTVEGKEIRRAFVPREKDWVILSADYSQIELRILAHISEDEHLVNGFKSGEDVHRQTAARIFDVPLEDVTGVQRDRAKTINYGVIYGMGAQRLAKETGLSQDEARDFIDSYYEVYPGIRDYIDRTVAYAKEHGFVETMLGRRRLLPDINTTDRRNQSMSERLAVNTPIQGTAADLIKVAMIRIDEKLRSNNYRGIMIIQVHDELVFDLPESEIEAIQTLVRDEMEHALELSVPLKVGIGWGSTWLEAH